ncbi:MAG: hypothetical protein GX088_06360 [Clostridia bacterium]|nr:hypothetical protein [Clostridia bacterium]
MPVKDIRFDYFQVYCKHYDKEKDEVSFLIFDLEPILEQAARLDAVQRTYQYYDEESRLQKVFPDNLNGTRIWGMQFLRIRKNLIPGIATDDGAYEPLELREGEYIGEEASALYDPQYSVLMLQRNRNSLSPTGIEAFFNKAWEEHTIQLRPIILPEDYIQFTEDDFYRCITVSFADVKTSQINGRSSLMKL